MFHPSYFKKAMRKILLFGTARTKELHLISSVREGAMLTSLLEVPNFCYIGNQRLLTFSKFVRIRIFYVY